MKNYFKILSVLLILVLLICSLPISVGAENTVEDNLIEIPAEIYKPNDFNNFPYMAAEIIPSEKDNSFYVVTQNYLYKHDIASNDTATVDSYYCDDFDDNYDYYNIRNRYVAGNNIYISLSTGVCSVSEPVHSKILRYNLESHQMETFIDIYGYIIYSIGADEENKVYLYGEKFEAGSKDRTQYIGVYDTDGNELSKQKTEKVIYNFIGFDETNDKFYINENYKYTSWGYTYDMTSVKMATIDESNNITLASDIISMVAQRVFYDRPRQAELFADRYMAVDATLYNKFCIYDLEGYESGMEITPIINIDHPYVEDELGNVGIYGTRSTYIEKTNSLFYCADNRTVEEFDLNTKEVVGKFKTLYDIYGIYEFNDNLLIFEKDEDRYYYTNIKISRPDSLITTPDEIVFKVGEYANIETEINGTYSSEVKWETDNPYVATVNEKGTVFAWSEGTAVITATASGLTAQTKITVEPNDLCDKSFVSYNEILNRNYNVGYNNYDMWSSPVNSYISEEANGNYTIVSGNSEIVYIDLYSDKFESISNIEINNPLTLFGGCYFGSEYNFLIFGQENKNEDDECEVIRVQKYSKDWSLIDTLSLYGENTYIPFDAGSLRMTEILDLLYVHTCHEMYDDGDGVHHQANISFVVNTEDMSLNQIYSDVLNIAQAGYVSHSFNQFVINDDEYVYRVDHGDAAPRGISITKVPIGEDITEVDYVIPIKIEGIFGDNATGTSVGGVECSTSNIIIAGNTYTDAEDLWSCNRNVFINITKKDFSETETIKLTDFDVDSPVTARTPHLIKLGDDQFMIMWEEQNKEDNSYITKALTFDSYGNITSDTSQLPCRLSDCEPILTSDGTVKWYISDTEKATIYSVNPFALNEASRYTVGDVNGDEKVNVKDATTIQKHLAKIIELSDIELIYADTTHDNKVSISDATKIQKYIAKIITEF